MCYLIFKKATFAVVSLFIFSAATAYGYSVAEAESEFEKAWNNPNYTQVKLDDIPINETLACNYDLEKPVLFTRLLLWDVEAKKAWDPKTYIPYVVRKGSSWGKETFENGDEIFVRASEQRLWMTPALYGEVFEKVFLNHKEQKATFIGTDTLDDSDGKLIHAERKQPLFHVQHSVEGEEGHPFNVWRIVHLTPERDEELAQAIKKLNAPNRVPGFVEIYIEKDLQTKWAYKKPH